MRIDSFLYFQIFWNKILLVYFTWLASFGLVKQDSILVYIVSVLVQTLVHIHTPFGGRHQHIEWPLYFWIISWVCKKLWYPQQFDSSISLLIFSLEISFHDLFLLALFSVYFKKKIIQEIIQKQYGYGVVAFEWQDKLSHVWTDPT